MLAEWLESAWLSQGSQSAHPGKFKHKGHRAQEVPSVGQRPHHPVLRCAKMC